MFAGLAPTGIESCGNAPPPPPPPIPLQAGDSVTLSGIFLPEPYTGQRAMLRASLLTATYMEVMHVKQNKQSYQVGVMRAGRVQQQWSGVMRRRTAAVTAAAGHAYRAEADALPLLTRLACVSALLATGDGSQRGAARRHRGHDRGGRHLRPPGQLHRARWVGVQEAQAGVTGRCSLVLGPSQQPAIFELRCTLLALSLQRSTATRT